MSLDPYKFNIIKVYLDDETFTTLNISLTATTQSICTTIITKKGLSILPDSDYSLFAVETTDEKTFERRMDDTEYPLSIMNFMSVNGKTENFKFIFRLLAPISHRNSNPYVEDVAASSDDEEGFFSQRKSQYMAFGERMGYMQKKGANNSSWRDRWFVLQGDKLHYFKTHQHANPIATIPLSNSFVSRCDTLSLPHVLSLSTTSRVYQLACGSRKDLTTWISCLNRAIPKEHCNIILSSIDDKIEEIEWCLTQADFKLQDEITNLQTALDNAIVMSHLLNFVHEQHSEENLLFWLDANEYAGNNKRTKAERLKRARDIYELYVQEGAEHQLFIHGLDLNFDLESDDDRTVFLPLQKKVFEQMKFGVFPEFLQSIHFQRCLLCLPHPIEFPSNDSWKLPTKRFIPELPTPFLFAKSLAQLNGVDALEFESAPDVFRSNSIYTMKSDTTLLSTFPMSSEPNSPVEGPSPTAFSPLSAVDSIGPLASASLSQSIEESKILNVKPFSYKNPKSALSPAAKEWKSRYVKTTLFSNDVVGASFCDPSITMPTSALNVKIQPYPKIEEIQEDDDIFSSKFLSSSHGTGMSPRDKFLS